MQAAGGLTHTRAARVVDSKQLGGKLGMSGAEHGHIMCSRCGASVASGQRFCTECGEQLAGGVETPQATLVDEGGPAEARAQGRQTKLPTWSKVVGPIFIVLLIALSGAAVFLATELSSARDENDALSEENAELSGALSQTRDQLRDAQVLSTRRKRVLKDAESVLNRVDPVLSSADTMQNLTSDMQAEQASFAANSDQVISYLATMVNYLGSTDAYYYDIAYIRGMLNEAVYYYDSSRGDADDLAGLSSRYDGASAAFERKATAYTRSIERLNKQLQAVTR